MIDIPDTGKEPSAAVAAVRAELMNGLATVEVFAEAIDKTPRQVQNYIRAGMPVVRYGKTPYVIVTPARDWLIVGPRTD
jgi:hypothetical protein